MITVGQPGGMIWPVGDGIGATHAAKFAMSPTRAAGRLPIMTFGDPCDMRPGPFGMHVGSEHGWVMLPSTAAGWLEISTFGTVLPTIGSGSAGCGTGVGTGAGGWIGA